MGRARTKIFSCVVACGLTVSMIFPAFAQCPAGIPSAGNPQCLPPDARVGSNDVRPATPVSNVPAWKKTWGAIAFDQATSKAGTSVGLLSEAEAKRAALDDCKRKDASDCTILFAYENQCSAVAWGTEAGSGRLFAWHAETIEKASELAASDCNGSKQTGCGIVYSACSLPVFE